MAFVTEEYYNSTFMGLPIAAEDFARFETWAERAVGALTRWRITADNFDSLPTWMQTAYKDAVCAQMTYYAQEGIDVAIKGVSDKSFTVGKVSVSNAAKTEGSGSMIAPLVYSILGQSGLIGAHVPVYERWGI